MQLHIKLLEINPLITMSWQECTWPILIMRYYYSHTNHHIILLQLFNYGCIILNHQDLMSKRFYRNSMQYGFSIGSSVLKFFCPTLDETWVFVMINIVSRLYKCIDIWFIINHKKHIIFDGFSWISNGNSDVVALMSSLSLGSYTTMHHPLMP